MNDGMVAQRVPVTGTGNGTHRFVYENTPLLIYWEITRACDLACRHCRAEAVNRRDPRELNTAEAKRLMETMLGFDSPATHLVLTGGDPLKRSDFFELLEYGARLGLRMSVAPSATSALTQDVFSRLRACGVESISLSLDGSSAENHDGFRGVPGCFDRTIAAARLARAEGLGLQINTLVTDAAEADLRQIYQLVSELDLMRWSLFFLISVGRGKALMSLAPERCEKIHNWLYELSKVARFALATTEAPHYRRVVLTRMRAEGIALAKIRQSPVGRGFGIRDGNGIMFISHDGDVYPAGFLPLVAGNVRATHIVEIYRHAEVFQSIRQTSSFKGRCGRCEFKDIYGGSRARAYAAHGDPLAEDPACVYEPPHDREHFDG